ncbi:YlbE-like family protein [Haloplasma contractile]|uniref:YlbE-like protein n=1 Tax=Haloplasma contractile SSD-17B TaxID=1033810 RepID=U2EEW3_9MOLU|nr:YlbE-like family protein [Haloplasma contractile]ERJ13488.1 YlbE-like protein [Haloplasma contractile SSD-17B]
MQKDILDKLYKEDALLFYLRTHPEWYRILERDPSQIKQFEKIAKDEMKLTFHHKINNIKNQMQIMNMMIEYINKSN